MYEIATRDLEMVAGGDLRGPAKYPNGSFDQTFRDAGHISQRMGEAINPFNWTGIANDAYEGYKKGGLGGGFLGLMGVEW
jgi:hypothetical protein